MESVSRAERLCSATSMHWIDCSFSRKVGMASTITVVERGRASIMYVSALGVERCNVLYTVETGYNVAFRPRGI